jgi:glycosyltransferase involved in cell wall biosynthesis
VRCFSDSTRVLLLRAYPDLDRARITVIPHQVDFAPSRMPAIDHRAPLVIGVVGHISPQKGAAVVKAIVERLDREHDDARVVVIGTLDAAPASPRLVVTGPYARHDLGTLVEANRVNMVLIPSICPETFSYATEEMMRLAMPIVAFDLGAPAERLQRYTRGRVCGEVTADAALRAMRDYHSELAARPMALAE